MAPHDRAGLAEVGGGDGGRGRDARQLAVVRELVDLQREAPLSFLRLSRAKALGEDYWGHHAANVAVLAISVLLVILVLAAQYESCSLPMVIVLTCSAWNGYWFRSV